jgi:hypothetical protein
MAAQQIESLEPVQLDSSIKLTYVPEGKSQDKENSNSLKQEFRISYKVMITDLPNWRVEPPMTKQYTLMPPRYLASTGRTCGNLDVEPTVCDPQSNCFEHFVTFEMNLAKVGPAFSHCDASYLAGATTVPLHNIAEEDDQCSSEYSVSWVIPVGRRPVTLCLELHYLTDVSEESVRLLCDSSEQNPASKSSLLNDVNTTGDLQLGCEVGEPFIASGLLFFVLLETMERDSW